MTAARLAVDLPQQLFARLADGPTHLFMAGPGHEMMTSVVKFDGDAVVGYATIRLHPYLGRYNFELMKPAVDLVEILVDAFYLGRRKVVGGR
ncbi:MAG: hypothetical protein H0U16_05985 [Actinobacteria bacterium]|nr:hypothetical protein [Actinomycetota bacterium]